MRKIMILAILLALLTCGAGAEIDCAFVNPETGYGNFDSEGYLGGGEVMSKMDMINNEDVLVGRAGALVSTITRYDADGGETGVVTYTLFDSEFGRVLKYDNGSIVGYGVGDIMYLERDGQHAESDFEYLMGDSLDVLWNGMCFFVDDAEKLCAFREEGDKRYILTVCDDLMMEYVTDSSLSISECRQYAKNDSGQYALKLICRVTLTEAPEIPSYIESYGSGT